MKCRVALHCGWFAGSILLHTRTIRTNFTSFEYVFPINNSQFIEVIDELRKVLVFMYKGDDSPPVEN